MTDEEIIIGLLVVLLIMGLIVYLIGRCVWWIWSKCRESSYESSYGSSYRSSCQYRNESGSRTLDLHGYSVPDAIDQLRNFLLRSRSAGCYSVTVITGRGLHSPFGEPKIRPAVINYLQNNNCSYDSSDSGRITVYL